MTYPIYTKNIHKRTLRSQNEAENKRGVLRTLHLHQQRHPQGVVSKDLGAFCCEPLPLDATNFENVYNTMKYLVC